MYSKRYIDQYHKKVISSSTHVMMKMCMTSHNENLFSIVNVSLVTEIISVS